MDSLMAVQLRNALSQALALERAAAVDLDVRPPDDRRDRGASHARLASRRTAARPRRRVRTGGADACDAAAVAAMSDDDIDACLLERLGVMSEP